MDRPKAIAIAVALTMSLTSGVVALAANTGALGFGGTPAAAARSTVAPASTNTHTASKTVIGERQHDDSERSTELGTDGAANARGEQ